MRICCFCNADDEGFKRKNGFTWPFDIYQVLSWVILLYVILMVYGTYCISFIEPWSYINASIFSVILIIYLMTSIIVMCIDPADGGKTSNKVTPNNVDVIGGEFCSPCRTKRPLKTKHCYACNKCVTHFDHHCVWLNNCIGRKNYRIFFASITSATIGCIYVFVIGILEFVFSFLENPTDYLTTNYYTESMTSCTETNCIGSRKYPLVFFGAPLNLWRAFVALSTIIGSVGIFFIGKLFCFHIFLKIKNMTTYEYITQSQDSHSINLKEKCLSSCLFCKLSSKKRNKSNLNEHKLTDIK